MTIQEATESLGQGRPVYTQDGSKFYYYCHVAYDVVRVSVDQNFHGFSFHDFNIALLFLTPPQKEERKKKNMSTLLDKVALLATSEPMRSFRKAGITNGDNILTDDGVKVFLTWLLKANQDKFKTEVVDDILAEMKEEKK